MGEEIREQSKKEVDLPPTEHEYWKHSEVQLRKMVDIPPCKHIFGVVAGNEIQCSVCKMGLYVDGRDSLIDGKLYRDGDLVF